METRYIVIIAVIIIILLLLSSSSIGVYFYMSQKGSDLPVGASYKDSGGTIWIVEMKNGEKRLVANRNSGDTYATLNEQAKTITFMPSGLSSSYVITSNGFNAVGDTFTKI